MASALHVLIIGAGPAGLGAAAACRERGLDFSIVEIGPRLFDRNHEQQSSLGIGVGGCGLFSDGKFSFYPSATRLWELADQTVLKMAYSWLATQLGNFGIQAPPFPLDRIQGGPALNGVAELQQKSYPSYYMPLEARKGLIRALEEPLESRLVDGWRVQNLCFDSATGVFDCRLASGAEVGNILARNVVFAGGRFGPMFWKSIFPQTPIRFRRVELGIRLEQPDEHFFLRGNHHLDPKLILGSNDPRYSWRTFCTCRDGEVVTIDFDSIRAVSGRGDDILCGPSNVGFNVRIADEKLGRQAWSDFTRALAFTSSGAPHSMPLGKLSARDLDVLGVTAGRLVFEGLLRLQSLFPELQSHCKVIAPAIEGVGDYPDVNNDLMLASFPVWVAGDASGLFRGLTAALVSGYYAGARAAA